MLLLLLFHFPYKFLLQVLDVHPLDASKGKTEKKIIATGLLYSIFKSVHLSHVITSGTTQDIESGSHWTGELVSLNILVPCNGASSRGAMLGASTAEIE